MKKRKIFCRNKQCENYGRMKKDNIVGFGSFPIKDGSRKRFVCTSCRKTFSERTDTVFYGLHTQEKTILMTLAVLPKCGSLRAASQFSHVRLNTVRLWLSRAVQHRRLVNGMLRKEFGLSKIEIDELWKYVEKKTKICI